MSQRVAHPGLDILPFRIAKVIEVIGTLRRAGVVAMGHHQHRKAHLCQRRDNAQPLLTWGVEAMHEEDPGRAPSRHKPRWQWPQLARDMYIIRCHAQRALRIAPVSNTLALP